MHKLGSLILGLVLACGFVVAPGGAPAQALSAGLAFTADDLPTWQTNGTVWALAQTGGTVFAGGTFSEIRPPGTGGTPESQSSFAGFDAATGSPVSCRPNVTGAGGTVRALATSPDGSTLYIGGDFAFVGGENRARLAALDVATCTLTPFSTPLINGVVRGLAVSGDTVYAAGEFQSVGSTTRQRFAAFDATTGTLLPWTANADDYGKAIAVSPDGSLVALGGDFFEINGQASHSMAIVDPTTGANIRNFPAPFVPDISTAQAIVADDTSFYFAHEATGGRGFEGKLAIAYSDLNERWRSTCEGATQAIAVSDGALYSAHHHHTCLSMGWFPDGMRTYLTAERTSDTEMLAWYPRLNDGLEEGIGARALMVAPAGGQKYLWVGGMFTQTNGKAQQGLTRFGQTPDTGNPPVPTNVSTESLITGQVKVRWRTVMDPDDGLLTYRVFRNGSLIGQVQAESRWWYRPQASFTDTTAVPGVTYSYQVESTDGTNTLAKSAAVNGTAVSASAPYAASVIADGATSYWRFDESSGLYGADSSLGDDNPQYARNPDYRESSNAISGEPGYAMGFNNSAYAWSDRYEEAPSSYSVELWFNTTTSRGGKLIGYGNQIPTNHIPTRFPRSTIYDRHVYMRNDGRLTFGVYTTSTRTVTSSQSYRDGDWHHMVATQGPAGMRLYVDGVQVGSNSESGNENYLGSWRVGGDNLSGWPSGPSREYFSGDIDEAAVYPNVLSAAQVTAHYEAGTGGASDTTAPSTPTNLAASLSGEDVDLTWTPSTDNVGVAGYEVHRSDTSGFTPTTATAITFTADPSYTDLGRPTGSWYYRIIASDAAGNRSAASAEAVASIIAAESISLAPTDDAYVHSGAPSTNFNGINQLSSRAPSPELASYLGFTLPTAPAGTTLAGARLTLRTSTAGSAGSTGAFNVSEASGAWSESTVTWANRPAVGAFLGQLPGDTVPNTEYAISLNPATLAGELGNATTLALTGTPGATDTLGLWSKEFAVASYRPALVLDFVPTGSADTTPPSEPTDLTAVANGADVDVTWTASTDDVGVTGYQVHRSATTGFTPTPGTQVATTTDPAYTDVDPGVGAWYYRVLATDEAGNASTPSPEASATVTPPPDTTPPTTPTNLSATASGADVDLSWTASTDNVAVTGYRVHRSDTSGFTPSPSTAIGNPTGATYTDASPGVGTWYYAVLAEDAAGNTSGPSAEATATVTAGGATVTETLTATDDAFVRSDTPAANYNGLNQLFGRAPAPELAAYLAFTLPTAPAGTELTGARLRVRTTTAASSGSAGTFDVSLATGAWTEATVTYDTRPTLGTVLGQLLGGSTSNTEYEIALDHTELAALLGDPTTLSITGEAGATDSLGLWSKEFAAASYRPALLLDFTPTP